MNITYLQSKSYFRHYKHFFLKYFFIICIIHFTAFIFAQTQNTIISSRSASYISNCDAVLENPSLIDIPNQELIAEMEVTTEDGWTHYYNCTSEKLLLSIYTQEQSLAIGNIEDNLIVKSGTKANYGTEGIDLSAASYIDNELWFSSNRYWSIDQLATPVDSLQIRFYIDSTDYLDLVNSFLTLPGEVNNFEQLNPFAITQQADDPYFLELAPGVNEAIIYGHDTALVERRDWIDGTMDGLYYSEFVVKNAFLPAFSAASGSIGFLFFLPDTPLSVAGQVLNAHGQAVDEVQVSCGVSATATSNNFGQYQCSGLDNGADISVSAEKEENYAHKVTVLDLNRMWTHLLGIDAFDSPYHIIAGDVDLSTGIANIDESLMHRLILQKETDLAAVPVWRFIPAVYEFPNPLMPFDPLFPEQIELENLLFDVFDQDFIGIKAGDVADEGDYPNIPALIVTPAFILSDHEVACSAESTITTELSVRDFTNLTGFQFSLEWDTSTVEFMAADGFNLSGFSDQNINTDLVAGGQLTFAWTSFPTMIEGVTKTENEVICQLQFRLKNTNSNNTNISFTNNPTPMQILRQNWSIVENPIFDTGVISVTGSNIEVSTDNIQAVTCFGEENGSININVDGGAPPYQFNWSNGANTEDINELPAGIYQVSIQDGENCDYVLNNLEVIEPEILIISAVVDRPSCDDANSGAITVIPQGGTSPYKFLWDDGSISQTRSGLSGGTYFLTVTDDMDCQTTETFIVPNGGMLTASVDIKGVSSTLSNDGRICVTNIFFGTSPYTYEWSNGETDACNESLSLGNYQLTITDSNGCENFFAYEISCCFTTAIDDIMATDYPLTISPNPIRANGNLKLQITVPNTQTLNIRLIDLTGRTLSQQSISASDQLESLLPVPDAVGLYLVEVTSEEGWRKVEKIIVF